MRNCITHQQILILLCLLITPISLAIASDKISIVDVFNRDANEIKNSIQGVISQEAVITVDQNKLIIKCNEQELATIKKIIANLDVVKRQLKIAVYWGDFPEELTEHISISTNRDLSTKVQTLYVEDGEMVALTKTNIVKLTKMAAGSQQQSTTKEYGGNKIDTTVVADVAKDIAETREDITRLSDKIKTIEETIAIRKRNHQPTNRLEQRLRNKQNQLFNANKNLHGIEAKQKSLVASNTKELIKQSDYTAYAGEVIQDHISLPEGIYITPIVLNDKYLKVAINIIEANNINNNSLSSTTIPISKQINTTMQIMVNQWQQIVGQDEKNNNSQQIISYTTAANNKKIWLKIELVD